MWPYDGICLYDSGAGINRPNVCVAKCAGMDESFFLVQFRLEPNTRKTCLPKCLLNKEKHNL